MSDPAPADAPAVDGQHARVVPRWRRCSRLCSAPGGNNGAPRRACACYVFHSLIRQMTAALIRHRRLTSRRSRAQRSRSCQISPHAALSRPRGNCLVHCGGRRRRKTQDRKTTDQIGQDRTKSRRAQAAFAPVLSFFQSCRCYCVSLVISWPA